MFFIVMKIMPYLMQVMLHLMHFMLLHAVRFLLSDNIQVNILHCQNIVIHPSHLKSIYAHSLRSINRPKGLGLGYKASFLLSSIKGFLLYLFFKFIYLFICSLFCQICIDLKMRTQKMCTRSNLMGIECHSRVLEFSFIFSIDI